MAARGRHARRVRRATAGRWPTSSVSPANNAGALAVGALDGSGQLAMFSSRGSSACDARPYPDLLAPGELAADHRPVGRRLGGDDARHRQSSFAAAVVAGELALLAQAHPDMPPAQREALLRGAMATLGAAGARSA